jgi:hypothetical protein
MDTIPEKLPPGWVSDALERSEAQIEAGHIVPLEPVLDRLRASIARMKAGSSGAARKVAPDA